VVSILFKTISSPPGAVLYRLLNAYKAFVSLTNAGSSDGVFILLILFKIRHKAETDKRDEAITGAVVN